MVPTMTGEKREKRASRSLAGCPLMSVAAFFGCFYYMFGQGWPRGHAHQKSCTGSIPMKARKYYAALAVGLVVALVVVFPTKKASANVGGSQFVVATSMLSGLAPGAVFPFIDTTPHTISQAHIAITDATTSCSAGAAAPSNVKVLVGQAGVSLVSVMGAATNTGISTTPGQCVFHVTINAGQGGVPNTVTDIVVLNGGASALTGINTVTASASVRVGEEIASWHQHGRDVGAGNST